MCGYLKKKKKKKGERQKKINTPVAMEKKSKPKFSPNRRLLHNGSIALQYAGCVQIVQSPVNPITKPDVFYTCLYSYISNLFYSIPNIPYVYNRIDLHTCKYGNIHIVFSHLCSSISFRGRQHFSIKSLNTSIFIFF